MAKRCKKGGLAQRFNESGQVGPGGLSCPCCADTRTRGKKKNKKLGRLVKRINRRKWKEEVKELINIAA